MDVDELQKWVGKHVVTDRPATPEEIEYYGCPTMGGAGVVVRIYQSDNGEVWVEMDWGMGWTLTEDTTIWEIGHSDEVTA